MGVATGTPPPPLGLADWRGWGERSWARTIRDDKKGGALKEDELVGLAHLAQLLEVRLQVVAIGDEGVNHL